MDFSTEAQKQRKIFVEFLGGLTTFQTFPDRAEDKDSDKRWKLTRVEHGTLAKMTRSLEYLNSQGAGIYVTVNETDGKGRKAENIVRVRCVFADLDGAPLAPVMDDMPDLVIESSPGKYHAYFKIADCPPAGFKQLQQAIAEKYSSDHKVCDLPRVMRVPGFWHLKGEPFMTRIVYKPIPGMLTFAEACEKWPPKAVHKFSAPRYAKPSNQDGEYRGSYGAPEGERNHHTVKRLCGAIKRGVRGEDLWNEALKEGLACTPPLSEHEIRAIYNSAQRYI